MTTTIDWNEQLADQLESHWQGQKAVKNRIHLDMRVGAENIEAETTRLTRMGATFLYRGEQGPHGWVTLADPEGNEFCVT